MSNGQKDAATRPPKSPGMGVCSQLTQMYPPKPQFTEKDLPDLSGNVYLVTGANSGVGKEVAQILYSRNAKVYIAARSESKANAAIDEIRKMHPKATGMLDFIHLDFADLTTIKPAVEQFQAKEGTLHVLFNNAGVQALKNDGTVRTAQGYELHFGVNVLGPFVLTSLLAPMLVHTAKTAPTNTVRVVWVSSMGLEGVGEPSKGISPDYLQYWPSLSALERYGVSKAGNWLYAVEFARRYRDAGVISVPCNPGNLKSELYREGGSVFKAVLSAVALYPPIYGAYTEVFSGLSPTITLEKSGKWVVPWGRHYPLRKDLLDATKSVSQGGNGHAEAFWEWTESRVKEFV